METMHPEVYEQWIAPFTGGDVVRESATYRLAVNEQLEDGERVQILVRPNRTYALVSPEVRDLPGVADAENDEALRTALSASGIALNGPDHLFFLDDATKQRLQETEDPGHVRRLTQADAAAFETFQAGVSEADLDGASVELDH